MATLNSMIDEVLSRLSGYGLRNDNVTYLSSELSSSGTIAVVADANSIGKGIIEIDDELIQVTTVDRTTGTLTLAPYGRGMDGTSAATHSINTKVTMDPKFSRSMIKTAINDTILSVFPKVYATGRYQFTATPAVRTYALPSSLEGVIAVSYHAIGATKEWPPVRGYRVDQMSNIESFGSKNTITIGSYVDPNRTVQVTYSCEPSVLESGYDDFATTTGLPDSMKDVIVLGACHNLLSFVEAGLMSYSSPEAQTQAGKLQAGSPTNVAKYIYALFQKRLDDEAAKQRSRYPIRVVYSS